MWRAHPQAMAVSRPQSRLSPDYRAKTETIHEEIMKSPNTTSPLLASSLLIVAMACAGDTPTNPVTADQMRSAANAEHKTIMCHKPDVSAQLIDVSIAARNDHES